MGFLDRLRGKKPEAKAEREQPAKKAKEETPTSLESICSDDKEIYEALYKTMLLDPTRTEVSMKEAEEKAKASEKQADTLRARVWYELAGGLAIYEGDVKKVEKYFGKCAELAPDVSYPILKMPDRAVAKAQEYYQIHLKKES